MADREDSEGRIFEAEGYRISIGPNVWQMCQENPAFAAALSVVVRDTEGGEKGGPEVLSVAVAKLSNMTTDELRGVGTLRDVLEPPSSFQ